MFPQLPLPRLPRLFSCLLFAALIASAQAQIEQVFQKTVPVPHSRQISIDTYHGPIRIEPSVDQQIAISVAQSVNTDDRSVADSRLKNLRILAENSADQLAITARYDRVFRWAWEEWPPVKITTEIRLPPNCTVFIRARDGGVTLPSISGNFTLNVASGETFAGEITGNLAVETTQGSITVTACSGDLDLRTRTGNILVGRTGRSAKITGTDGEIEVQRVQGPLTLRGDRAPVKVGFPAPILNQADLSTSGEELTVLIDPAAPCTLQAQAGTFGQVQIESPLVLELTSGALNTSKLSAHHKGGGSLLTLKASGGHVRLKALPVLPVLNVR